MQGSTGVGLWGDCLGQGHKFQSPTPIQKLRVQPCMAEPSIESRGAWGSLGSPA